MVCRIRFTGERSKKYPAGFPTGRVSYTFTLTKEVIQHCCCVLIDYYDVPVLILLKKYSESSIQKGGSEMNSGFRCVEGEWEIKVNPAEIIKLPQLSIVSRTSA